jgi:hypothetical protein
MKFYFSLLSIIICYYLASGVDTLTVGTANSHDVEARDDPNDRGTFIIYCAGREPEHSEAYGACNNACYSINCIRWDDPNANVMNIAQDKSMNRLWSGCRTTSDTVRNYSPFNQLFVDLVGLDLGTTDCDEWSMADEEQTPPDNARLPNSLRLMPQEENRCRHSIDP